MSRLGRSLACGAITAALLLGGWAGVATAATLTVTTTSDSLAADGQCSLREAIAAANAPGTPGDCGTADALSNRIVLGPHEYELSIKLTGEDDQTTGDLDVNPTAPPLTIEGAGAGSTEISGAQLKDRIMHVLPGAKVTLRDLTATEGRAPDGAEGEFGTGSPTFKPPTNGSPGFQGGGILNGGMLTLEDVAVTDNRAGNGGSGGEGIATEFFGGADGGAGGAGGGIENSGSLTLADVTVSGNRAGDGGRGGIGDRSDVLGMPGGDGGCCGDGGGLANAGGTVGVSDSTFSDNRAGDGGSGGFGGEGMDIGGEGGSGAGGSSGGGIASAGGSISITDTTIQGNASGLGGSGGNGGLSNPSSGKGGDAGNGSAGGALFVSGGSTATLENVTVDGNLVGAPGTPGKSFENHVEPEGKPGQPAFGGGIYANTTPAIAVSNTLLGTNQLGNCAGNVSDGGHNLSFGSAGCPAGFLVGDPKLGPLADNGGPTETMALGAGSAAIDQVPSGPGCPDEDQRGVPRPSGGACDIGAYEVTPPAAGTAAASAITRTGATLNASVTPNAGSAGARFEFGTSPAHGSTTALQTLAGGLQPQPVSATLAGLAPGTTYHFRLVATSPDGTTQGAEATFTTAAAPAVKPQLSHLKVTPPKVGRKGAKIGYQDSEAATTSFQVLREAPKPRRDARCAKRSGGCGRLIAIGGFSHADAAGPNSLRLPRRIAHHKLTPGAYELQATPRNANGAGAMVSARFRVG